jgi:hypothetical protein
MTASKTPSSLIISVSPNQISACDSSVDISVMGTNLSTKKEDYYLGTIRATNISDNSSGQNNSNPRDVHSVTVTFENLQQNNNKALNSLVLTMIRPDGIASATIDVGGASCSGAKSTAPPPFTFTSAIAALAPGNDPTITMRVLLSFPAGKISSIAISAKGGEITNAAFTDSTQPANVTSPQITSGTVTVTTPTIPSKDAKPFGLDLTFRRSSLVIGQTLTLTATAKPPTTIKADPINISIVPRNNKKAATTAQ